MGCKEGFDHEDNLMYLESLGIAHKVLTVPGVGHSAREIRPSCS